MALEPHWIGDGSFDTAPKIFHLNTVHALINEFHTIAFLYCIMQRRISEIYEKMFNELRRLKLRLNHHFFTNDYERSTKASIYLVFPEVKVCDCFFHFDKCIYKVTQRIGLQTGLLTLIPPRLIIYIKLWPSYMNMEL